MTIPFLFDIRRVAITKHLLALYTNRLLQALASAMLGVFLPIFLFEQSSFNLHIVLFYFLLGFALYLILNPIGARVMSAVGQRRSMLLSMPFFVAYFLSLYFFERNPAAFFFLTTATITCWRILYWAPYHTDFAGFSDRAHRGRQLGLLESLYALFSIVVPVVGGFIISAFGFDALFIMLLILVVLSALPLALIPETHEQYDYGYAESFQKLFTKSNRRLLVAYAADGADSTVGLVVWPIFIYLALDGKYLDIGGVSSLIVVATVVVRLVTGRYTDSLPKRRLLRIGTLVYATGWAAKAFVTTAFQIFAAGAYHNLGTVMLRTTFDTMMYEQAADRGHYVDEYTVLREQAMNVGRILMLLFLMVLLSFLSLSMAFVVAALASLFHSALR